MDPHVFLVDDNVNSNQSLAQFLESKGCNVDTMISPEECIATLEEETIPDIILMNIHFGRDSLDGPTAAEIINREYDIPILFHSAQTDETNLQRTKEVIQYGCIKKSPDNKPLVLSSIETALKLYRSKKLYRDLWSHLQDLWEEQNASIAREMHDDIGQSITALKMNLKHMENFLEPINHPGGHEEIDTTATEMKQILNDMMEKIRSLMTELRPPGLDVLGLVEALRMHLREVQKEFGIDVKLITDNESIPLEKKEALHMFRILEEAVTNSVKHGDPKSITVSVRAYDNRFALVVEDDGKGFDVEEARGKKSFGLFGMEERAKKSDGDLNVSSSPGRGTRIEAVVPRRTCYD